MARNVRKIEKEKAGADSAKKWSKYKEHEIAVISACIAIFAALYAGANYFFNFIYQSKCQAFYKIEGDKFHKDIGPRVIYLVIVILGIIYVVSPLLLKRKKEKKLGNLSLDRKIAFTIMGVCTGIVLGEMNSYNIVDILQWGYYRYALFPVIVEWTLKNIWVIFNTISLGIITSVSLVWSKEALRVKHKLPRVTFIIVFAITMTINVLLLLGGTMTKLSINLENKLNYEAVNYEDKLYLVLSSNEDTKLIAPVEYKNDEIILKTSWYREINQTEGVYTYIEELKKPLTIE